MSPKSFAVGLVLAASGLMLLVGFRTSLASAVLAFTMVTIAASWVGRPVETAINSPLSEIYSMTIAIALTLIGPGSMSLDCRLYGPREIIIPPANGRD